jgi:hypothetical protein
MDRHVRTLADPGYRDAGCALIGHLVIGTAACTDTGLFLDLSIGSASVRRDRR